MLIAFIGSVFSPYYAWARQRGGVAAVPAERHVALNLALVPLSRGAGRAAWTMTERGIGALDRGADWLAIGPSTLRWFGDGLQIDLDEWGLPWPWPSRVRGRIRLWPRALGGLPPQPLSPDGQHRWWPIAPRARVELALDSPGLRWSGEGYLDSNRGPGPLAEAFHRWQWARAAVGEDEAAVWYEAWPRGEAGPGSGGARLALRFDRQGRGEAFEPPPIAALPGTGWGLPRSLPGALAAGGRVLTLQDAPFYARSLVPARWGGRAVRAMHEQLGLDRLDTAWVRAMLPFRMPRRG